MLRSPADLEYAISVLERKKFRKDMFISDYKLTTETNKFKIILMKNIDDGKHHIKATLQNIILTFGSTDILNMTIAEQIAHKVAYLNPKGTGVTQSNVWVPLIWKALNYLGFDVPPEWIEVKLNNNEDYIKFNDAVKQLASIPGWGDYAFNILSTDNETYPSDSNDFTSKIVIQKSKENATNYIGKDFTQYKMASYIKYLKYKQKYLSLQKLLNIN
jgi:hypothetical protein